MMKSLRFFYAFLLATIGSSLVSTTANAISFIPRSDLTDSSFEQLLDNDQFTEVFVAQGRIGNNAIGGTQEFDLLNAGDNLLPVATGQRVWEIGEAVDFALEYTENRVNYSVGGELLSSSLFSGPFTDIFLRTRAAEDSIMMLSDLVLNGLENSGLLSASIGAPRDIDYLQISNLPKDFTLSGKATFAWIGEPPENSQLAYQIKVGRTTPPDVETVPEPSLVLALAGGACLLSLKKSKRDRI